MLISASSGCTKAELFLVLALPPQIILDSSGLSQAISISQISEDTCLSLQVASLKLHMLSWRSKGGIHRTSELLQSTPHQAPWLFLDPLLSVRFLQTGFANWFYKLRLSCMEGSSSTIVPDLWGSPKLQALNPQEQYHVASHTHTQAHAHTLTGSHTRSHMEEALDGTQLSLSIRISSQSFSLYFSVFSKISTSKI